MSVPYQMTPSRSGTFLARSGTLLALATVVLAWALLQGGLASFREAPLAISDLVGPDSYMRLVRVTELAQGGGWFDNTITRANAPYGDVLHWTRPFDVLILALALPASLAVETEQAIYFTGLTISPLLNLLTAFLLVWALRPMLRPAACFLGAIVFFLQPAALSYSSLGRADHHSLLMLVFVVVAGFTLRALLNPADSRSALFAGAWCGFGMWLSVEFLLPLAACLAALGLPWLLGKREKAGQNKWYALGLSCMILLALFAERPLAQLLDASYDSVSSVQFFLAVGILVFWWAVELFESRRGPVPGLVERVALAIFGVATFGLLLFLIYPLFFAGPMAEIDPRIVPIWLDHVLEMVPLTPTDRESLGKFILYLGSGVLIGLPFLRILLQERHSKHFPIYFFVLIASLLFTLAALRHLRFAVYAEIAYVLAIAIVLDHFLITTRQIRNDLLRGLLRGGFIGAVFLGPLLIGTALLAGPAAAERPGEEASKACNVEEMASYLEADPRWSAAPKTVLAFMDIGPELLYRTRHRVIGTPYHRNAEGISDGYHALASRDSEAARRLIDRRGIDLVLLCPSVNERRFYKRDDETENLYLRLARGDPPSWLAAVELPAALQEQTLLYRVLR